MKSNIQSSFISVLVYAISWGKYLTIKAAEMLHYVDQLVANFICQLFGAEQVVYSAFIRAFSLPQSITKERNATSRKFIQMTGFFSGLPCFLQVANLSVSKVLVHCLSYLTTYCIVPSKKDNRNQK